MRENKAYQYSIRLLAQRDYSQHKLKKKLIERKFENEEIDEAIEILTERNYLREDEYKKGRVRYLLRRGYTNSYIIKKCEEEFIPVTSEFINVEKNDLKIDDKQEIYRLIEKKLRYKTIPTDYDKKSRLKASTIRYLLSRGFNYQDINNQYEIYLTQEAQDSQ